MSTPLGVDLSTAPEGLGVLAFRGADTAKFLQGQLSADIGKLAPGATTLAGLHNPQGRVVALFALLRTAEEEILAVLPRELIGTVASRLRKFILRAKVRIEDLSTTLMIAGSANPPLANPLIKHLPWGRRWLLVVPADQHESLDGDAHSISAWQRADIAEGLPQVYAATSENFVAQMLNLDLLGAIAFDKGCYTGQEIIARAHYRGRVKRRLQRWHGAGNYVPRAGDAVRSSDGRALTVVRAAAAEASGWDVLAVGPFAAAAALESVDSEPPEDEPTVIQVQGPLPLPYSLPE
jgi:hypothetical protein